MNNLEALIECYLDICQYEKKLSQDTLKAYRTDLAQFRAFVGGAEVSPGSAEPVYQISEQLLRAAVSQTEAGLPAGLLSFDGDTGSDFTESL